MRILSFILISFLTTIGTIHAQDTDVEQVKKTVSFYLDGGTNNDFETLKKAFHKDARMKYLRGGKYYDVNALEFFKSRMKPGPKQKRETKIASVSITGNAASAILEIEYDTFTFTDYMNLLKIDGKWQVVNKIFFRKNK